MEKSEAQKEYELKKKEKLEKKALESKKHKRSAGSKKILWAGVFVVVIILVFLGLRSLVQNNTPSGEDFSRSIPSAGRGHIEIGTLPQEGTYSSNPPSSGPHYPNTARTGFYDTDQPVQDQFVIHNLEHGDIWIAYHPRISESTKEIIKAVAGRFVIVSPREENEEDIYLVAWGRLDGFSENQLTEQRIKDFILRYDNKGPEQVRGGGGHQVGAFN